MGMDVWETVQVHLPGNDPEELKRGIRPAPDILRRRQFASDAAFRHAGGGSRRGPRTDSRPRPGRRLHLRPRPHHPGRRADGVMCWRCWTRRGISGCDRQAQGCGDLVGDDSPAGPHPQPPSATAGALDCSLARPLTSGTDNVGVKRLRWFWLDGLFATISANFYGGFVGLFALAFGASNAQVGQLTAVGSLCGLVALFPGARAIETLGGTAQNRRCFVRRHHRAPGAAGMGAVAVLAPRPRRRHHRDHRHKRRDGVRRLLRQPGMDRHDCGHCATEDSRALLQPA